MKKVYILLLIVMNYQYATAQVLDIDKIEIKRLSYLGTNSLNRLVFYKSKTRKDNIEAILSFNIENSKLKIISNENEINGFPEYYTEKLRINGFPYQKQLFIKYLERDSIYQFPSPTSSNDFSLTIYPNSDTILISAYSTAPIYIFNKKSFEFYPLPLIGGNLHVKGDYLFFETLRFSDNFSDFPENIYRVHKNDLKNPEQILIQVEEEWYPFSEEVVYARTFPKIGKCEEIKCQGAFYNLTTNKFSVEPEYIPTHKIIKIKGNSSILDIVIENRREVFKLKDIPKPPQTFPYKMKNDYTQKPRGNIFKYFNIPLKEKTLPNTFVTHELLYNGTEAELKKLTKEQLRILRNTFFAFQGYKFNSGDLMEFFSQFEWYKKMTMGDKSNEDVVIWPDEKIRVDLIRAIEESK